MNKFANFNQSEKLTLINGLYYFKKHLRLQKEKFDAFIKANQLSGEKKVMERIEQNKLEIKNINNEISDIEDLEKELNKVF